MRLHEIMRRGATVGEGTGAIRLDANQWRRKSERMACMQQRMRHENERCRKTIGEIDLADRLEHCMTVRRERRGGDGWPRLCRSAACAITVELFALRCGKP
jgi:hypothetical protein